MPFDFQPTIFPCVNCEKPIPWDRPIKIFCSDLCRDEADYVRYYRRCLSDGRSEMPDIQEALRIKLAHLLSGGYSASERKMESSVL